MKSLSVAISFAMIAAYTHADDAQFTTGPAEIVNNGLIDCGQGSRVSMVGKIKSIDGTVRTVPAATNYLTAPKATDLYNACSGIEPKSLSEIDFSEIRSVDLGGSKEYVAYVFADNYFEMYVDGELVGVDAVPFTPFNSSIIKFKAEPPITIAIMGVDWEENLALGSEAGRGSAYYPGDAGIVVHITDELGNTVTITDESWRAQTFYTSPLKSRDCLKIKDRTRDTSDCDTSAEKDGTSFSAAFWDIPEDWMEPAFDDSVWPRAVTYSNKTVGVNNKPAFTNFSQIFDAEHADAEFIWSSNLILDNLVLMRKTIE